MLRSPEQNVASRLTLHPRAKPAVCVEPDVAPAILRTSLDQVRSESDPAEYDDSGQAHQRRAKARLAVHLDS
jgi:hypothetical protein